MQSNMKSERNALSGQCNSIKDFSLAKLYFGQQNFFQCPRALCDASFTCEVARSMSSA